LRSVVGRANRRRQLRDKRYDHEERVHPSSIRRCPRMRQVSRPRSR